MPSKLLQLEFYRLRLSQLATFLAFVVIVYEFPASVVIEVLAAFGAADTSAFIKNRLLFAALVVAVSLINLLVNFKGIFKSQELKIYIFILVYMFVVVLLNRDQYAFFTLEDTHSMSAIDYWTPKFFKYLLFLLVGLQLVNFKAYRHLLLLSLAVSGAVVLLYVDYEFLGLNKREFVSGASQGIHLFLGDAFAITSLLTIALYKSPPIRLLIIIFSVIVIFFIGSRTSFAVFVFTVLLYQLLLFRIKLLPYYLFICLALVGYGSTLDFEELAETNKRMVGVFLDYEDDGSVQGRKQLSEKGWEDIRANPIFGRFGGQRDSGLMFNKYEWNSYMHSVFSYWRQFGILIFSLIIYLYFRLGSGVAAMIESRNTPAFRVYFLLSVFILVESFFSRSYAFTVTHILFGMAVSVYLKNPTGVSKASVGDRYNETEKPWDYDFDEGRRRKRKRKKRIRF